MDEPKEPKRFYVKKVESDNFPFWIYDSAIKDETGNDRRVARARSEALADRICDEHNAQGHLKADPRDPRSDQADS